MDIWPILTHPPAPTNYSAAHPTGLVLTKEVIVLGQYKLILAQNFGWPPTNDWWLLNGTKVKATLENTPVCGRPDAKPSNDSLLGGIPGQRPCLFDIRADVGERKDLGAEPALASVVESMWRTLNMTVLSSRDCSAVGGSGGHSYPSEGIGGCSPTDLLGNCDAECASAYWAKHYGQGQGPICGVPGC